MGNELEKVEGGKCKIIFINWISSWRLLVFNKKYIVHQHHMNQLRMGVFSSRKLGQSFDTYLIMGTGLDL